MGNRKMREFLLRQQNEQAWVRTQIEERSAGADVHAHDIGFRRLQFICCPSFSEGTAWEIRQHQENWHLFRSRVVPQRSVLTLVGYDPINVASAVLEGYFAQVAALTLSISPFNGRAGADGTTYQIAVFDLFCELRFKWWEDPPPQWEPLSHIVAEMNSLFTT